MSAKKFFEENSNLLDAKSDPVRWNINNGLLAMSEQLERIEERIDKQDAIVQLLNQLVR